MPRLVETPFGEFPVGFDRLYGLEIVSIDEEEVRAQARVRDELRQPAGLVHGGVFASMAESMTSIATWLAVHEDGKTRAGAVEPDELPAPDRRRHDPRHRPPPPPRPHDLGLGGRHHRRPGPPVRARPDDRRGPLERPAGAGRGR